MIKIDDLLNGLLATLDAVVVAASEEDQDKMDHYSGYADTLMKLITAHWAEMVGALDRAERTISHLGNQFMHQDLKAIAFEEANNLRKVLAKVKEE